MFKQQVFPLTESSKVSTRFLVSLPCYLILGSVTLRTYVINTLIPYLMEDLNASDYLATAMLVQTLAMIIMLPVGGRLGDMFGRKQLTIFTQIPYIICVCICAFSNSIGMFFVFFFLMSMFNGVSNGYESAMLMDIFSGKLRTSYLSYLSPVAAIFGFGGTYVAAWIADLFTPQIGLLFLAFIAILVFIATLFLYPDIKREKATMRGFDWWGLIAMILFVAPLGLMLSAGGNLIPWRSVTMLILGIVCVVALIVFVRRETKYSKPIMSLKLFKVKNYVPTLLFALTISLMTGLTNYVSVYAAQVLQYPAQKTALIGFFGLINIVLGPVVGKLLNRSGKFRPTMWVSIVFFIIADIFTFLISPTFAFIFFAIRSGIGVCCRTFGYVSWNALYGVILPQDQRGIGMATDKLFTQLGTLINTAILGFMMNSIAGGIAVSLKYMAFLYLAYAVVAIVLVQFFIKEPSAG